MSGSLPAGFTLDAPAAPPAAAPASAPAAAPALPAGFTLDAPAASAAGPSDASLGIQDAAPTATTGGPVVAQTADPVSGQAPHPSGTGGYLGDVLHTAIQDTTFGLGDKLAAAGYAAAQPLTGDGSGAQSFRQRYAANLATERTREAGESYAATLPGHVLGLGGMVAGSMLGVPEAVAGATGLSAAARAAAPVTDAIGGAASAVLTRLPGGASVLVPAAKLAATGAAIGGAQGAVDADGSVADHLKGAEQGAIVGGVLGPVAGGAAALGGMALRGVKGIVQDTRASLGMGDRSPIMDRGVQVGPAVTDAQASAAQQQILAASSDPAALPAKLDAAVGSQTGPQLVPDFKPTSFQATGDAGLGQAERGISRTPDAAPLFNTRANEQSAALSKAVQSAAPADSSSASVTDSLNSQQAQLASSGQAATDQAAQDAQQATSAIGAPLPQGADAQATALQDMGAAQRQTLSDADSEAGAHVNALYNQIDPEGTAALDVSPIKQAVAGVRGGLTASEVQPDGEEAAIHSLVKGYPDVQSLSEVQALEGRIKTAVAAQRAPGGDPNVARRLGMVLDGVQDAKGQALDSALGIQDAPAQAAAQPSASGAAPSAGNTVYTPSGGAVGVKYEIANAPDLVTSHTDDMTPNPAFPSQLQPRDRGRAASQSQVSSITNKLQPERLGASTTASDGAPIVGPDNIVESGNARTIAIRRAYAQGGQQAQSYRDFLTSQGHDIAGFPHPVLIRRRTTDMTPDQRVDFTREANGQTTLASSAGEIARQDAQRITPEMLEQHAGGDVADPGNRDMVRSFAKSVISPQEQGSFATADGQLSRDGAQRMRNAMTARAYGDRSLTDALAETNDPRTRVLASGLEQAAPAMARLKMGIERGDVDPNVDLSSHVSEALAALRVARDQRIPLADVVKQRDVFSSMSPQSVDILHAAYGPDLTGRASAQEVSQILQHYARMAGQQTNEARLFGENLGAGQVLTEARTRYGRDAEQQAAIASSVPATARTVNGSDGFAERQPVANPGRQSASAGGGTDTAGGAGSALPEPEKPALVPNFSQETAEAMRAANAAHRDRRQTFTRSIGVGDVLKGAPSGRGGYAVPDSQVPSRLFSSGSGAAERVQAALKAGMAPADMGNYAAFALKRAAESSDGTLDVGKYQRFMSAHREAFDALTRADPEVGKGFATAQAANERLIDVRQQSAAKMQEFQTSVARHFLDGRDPEDAFGKVLGTSTRVSDMRKLVASMNGDKQGLDGLQAAGFGHIVKKYIGNAMAGDTGERKLKSDQFQTFVRGHEKALAEVFTPNQMATLKASADDLQRASLSDGTKIGGGSDTAQNAPSVLRSMLGNLKNNAISTVTTSLAAPLGAMLDGATGALLGGAAGKMLGDAIQTARGANIKTVQDLVTQAYLHPELMRVLLAKVTPQSEPHIAKAFTKAISRVVASAGAQAVAPQQ